MSSLGPDSISGTRVLHVTTCLGGGVPQAIVDHITATPELEHHVLWPIENDFIDAENRAAKYPMPTRIGERQASLKSVVQSVSPDLVVAHSTGAGLLTRLTRHRKYPLIYQPHGYAFEAGHRPAWQRKGIWMVESALASRSEVVAAITPRELNLAKRLGSRTVTVVHNCSHAHASRRAPSGRFSVAMSGRIAPQKDPLFFAEVARKVKASIPDARFRWIGDGEPALRGALEAAGVEVTGWIASKEAWRLMSEASVYAHTAEYEGFPLTVLDAARLGLPLALRQIPAFEGLTAYNLDSATEMATFLTRCASGDGSALREALLVKDRIAADSTEDAQRFELLTLYTQACEGRG